MNRFVVVSVLEISGYSVRGLYYIPRGCCRTTRSDTFRDYRKMVQLVSGAVLVRPKENEDRDNCPKE